MRFAVDLGHGEIALEARQNLAVQASPVAFGACLELGVEIFRNVLERQGEQRLLLGTIMEPS